MNSAVVRNSRHIRSFSETSVSHKKMLRSYSCNQVIRYFAFQTGSRRRILQTGYRNEDFTSLRSGTRVMQPFWERVTRVIRYYEADSWSRLTVRETIFTRALFGTGNCERDCREAIACLIT